MGQLRVAKTKVRTGCRTCKKRRVKCDEEKPECRRCVSGGRLCEGYEVVAQRQVSPSTQRILLPGPRNISPQTISAASTRLSSPVSSLPGASPDEIYYFDYFCKYTAPTLCGPFASRLFERFILQLGRREPLIRHAATALAALQIAQYRNGRTVLNQEEAGFALTQYGKSIAIMRSTMISSRTSDSQRLALVACILFVAFEIAQKRFAETAMHLEQGLNMMTNVRYAGHLPDGWDVDEVDTSDEGSGLDVELLRTFDRLDIQSSFFRTTKTKLRSDPIKATRKTPRRFTSLEQARSFLDAFMRTKSAFMMDVRATPSPISVADTCRLQEQQADIRRQLQVWNAAFRQYKLPHVPLPADGPSPPDAGVRACLEATAISNSILLETAISDGRECVFDSFTSEFQMIIDLAEISRSHPRPTTKELTVPAGGSCFHLHMACIPAVYFTAYKCRDPYIRRKAIGLLENSSFREGLWDGPMGARLMEHICELEESGYEGVFTAEDLPEEARIHEILFDIEDRKGGVMTSYKRRDFAGEYGEPGACWVQWTDRANIQLESMEASHY